MERKIQVLAGGAALAALFTASVALAQTSTPTTTPPTATSTSLAVNLTTVAEVVPGVDRHQVALVRLSAGGTGEAVRVTRVPIVASFAGASSLSSCSLSNLNALNTPLSNTIAALGNGTNTFDLSPALSIARGTVTSLALTCNVSPAAPLGTTVAFSVTPANVVAEVAANGADITPVSGGAIAGVSTFSATQGTPSIPTTPGVPSTGLGETGVLGFLLAGVVSALGLLYLYAARRSS